jgi:hypothetical protein
VRRAVEVKLAEGADIPVWRPRNGVSAWFKVMVGAAVASVATAALAYAVWRPKPVTNLGVKPSAVSVRLPSTEKTVSNVTATVPDNPAKPREPAVVASQPNAARAGPAAVIKSESLADEVKLLGSVHSAIQNHDGGQALRLLRTYDQQFKKPQLREERAAAGVLALCAAGQVAAARNAARRFQSGWPRSPLMARVTDSCAAAK